MVFVNELDCRTINISGLGFYKIRKIIKRKLLMISITKVIVYFPVYMFIEFFIFQ
jgi:hypothetical protein